MTSSVSVHIITRESEERLADVVRSARPHVDEIFIGVDSRSTDATADIARAHADRFEIIRDHDFLHFYERVFDQCRSEWILLLDDDETLSSSWSRGKVAELIESPTVTNYYIPRKWVVPPGDRYVCDVPLYPNFAMRLFRNDRSLLDKKDSVHSQIPIRGPSGFLGELHIVHRNFEIYSREQREAKIAFYRRQSSSAAGAAGEAYYLYEDFGYDTAPMDVEMPPAWGREERADWPYSVDTRITEAPTVVRAGRTYFFLSEIRNRSNRTLVVRPHAYPHPNPEFSCGIHWFGAEGSNAGQAIAGGAFDPIWLPIQPGQTRQILIRAVAPLTCGRYWMRADVFELNAGWFSQRPGVGYQAFRRIEVRPDTGEGAESDRER
jgi:hypothetical protein